MKGKKRKRKRKRKRKKRKKREEPRKVWKLRVLVWMLDFGMDFCMEFSSFM